MIIVYDQRSFLLFAVQSFLCGVLLGVVYDALRSLRILLGDVPSGKKAIEYYEKSYPLIGCLKSRAVVSERIWRILLFAQDLLFAVLAGVLMLIICFFRNDGKVRCITYVIAFSGFVCYRISIGRIALAIIPFAMLILRLAFAYTVFIIGYPVKLIFGIIKKYTMALSLAVYRRIAFLIYRKRCVEYKKRLFCEADKMIVFYTAHGGNKRTYKIVGGKKCQDKSKKEG